VPFWYHDYFVKIPGVYQLDHAAAMAERNNWTGFASFSYSSSQNEATAPRRESRRAIRAINQQIPNGLTQYGSVAQIQIFNKARIQGPF
jgi:hypothetical protein